MSEERRQVANQEEYERQDLNISGVLVFLAGLAVICLISGVIVWGMYRYLESRDVAQQVPQNPLVSPKGETRKASDIDTAAFPLPRLQKDDVSEMDSLRKHEIDTLSTYDWVDKQAGTVRIPIERAIDLTAQRGLPTRAPGAALEPVPQPKPAAKQGKAPEKKGPGSAH
jgi:hypothetical protein